MLQSSKGIAIQTARINNNNIAVVLFTGTDRVIRESLTLSTCNFSQNGSLIATDNNPVKRDKNQHTSFWSNMRYDGIKQRHNKLK